MTALSREELKDLFVRERDRLFRMLWRLTGSPQDAEDLLQETFLAVWRKRRQFERRGAPEGYLRRTAVRLYLNARERRARRGPMRSTAELEARALASAAATPADGAERDDALAFLAARVREALDALPPASRDAFLLFRCDGFTCREIAELTGVGVKTVETRLRRATLALAERMKHYESLLPAS